MMDEAYPSDYDEKTICDYSSTMWPSWLLSAHFMILVQGSKLVHVGMDRKEQKAFQKWKSHL